MTPKLSVRSFTSDQFILDKVFYTNYYKVKGTKIEAERPVVVDIGAHAGYFSFAALSLGAKVVHSFEPFIDNYVVLLQNVYDNQIGKVIPHQLAVSPVLETPIISLVYPKSNGSYFELAYLEASPMGNIYTSPAASLDTILSRYVVEQVDILKISIGYTETQILLNSNRLQNQVKYICGETLMDEDKILEFKDAMRKKGYPHAHIAQVEGEAERIMFIFGQEELTKRFNVK